MKLIRLALTLVSMSTAGIELAVGNVYQNSSLMSWLALLVIFAMCHVLAFGSVLFGALVAGMSFWLALLGWATIGNGVVNTNLVVVGVCLAIFESYLLILVLGTVSKLRRRPIWLVSIIIATLWGAGEITRSYGEYAMPYGELGATQTRSCIGLLLPYIGTHGVGIIMIVSAYVFTRVLHEHWRCTNVSWGGAKMRTGLAMLGSMITLLYLPLHVNEQVSKLRTTDGPRVSLLTHNIALTSSSIEYVSAELRRQRSELLILPEGAIDGTSDYTDANAVGELNAASDVPIISGAVIELQGRHANSALLFRNGGRVSDLYVKRRLVPFGEYVPALPFASALIHLPGGDLLRGERLAIWPLTRKVKVAPLICYEIAFGSLARDAVISGADALVVPVNDDWFSSDAGIQLQYSVAQTRAMELGVDVLLVPSRRAAFDFHADGSSTLAPANASVSSLTIRPKLLTPYARFGDTPIFVLATFTVTTILILALRGRSSDDHQPTTERPHYIRRLYPPV